MRAIHTSHQNLKGNIAATCDWLEIRRGRTRFPHRPLSSSRILIGSGTNCHLQLGGGVPMLHSLLTFEGDCWTLDVIAPEPSLVVNGEACRHRVLCIGDRIQLAEFEFVLCRSADGPPKRTSQGPHRQMISPESFQQNVGDLSAAELVERMEQEIASVESVEKGRRQGAKALLEAAAQSQNLNIGNHRRSQHRGAA